MARGPRTVKLGFGAPYMRLDACPTRQFLALASYFNRLSEQEIWSTIKSLPATLHAPRFKEKRKGPAGRGSRREIAVKNNLSTEGGGLRGKASLQNHIVRVCIGVTVGRALSE